MSHTLLLPAVPVVPASKNEELFKPALSYGHVRAQLAPGLTLVVGKPLASPLALPFCAPWLEQGETVVAVDGANCFNLYRLTEWAKRKRLDSPALLQRLRIARAFTPFQLATILHHIGADMERHRATRLVLTGLPDCLYDEELSEAEARNTFARCRKNLLRLAERHTVLAFSDGPVPPGGIGRRASFLDALISEARLVLETSPTEPETTPQRRGRFAFVPVKAPGLLTIAKEAEGAEEA
jgi:hypothetical protein